MPNLRCCYYHTAYYHHTTAADAEKASESLTAIAHKVFASNVAFPFSSLSLIKRNTRLRRKQFTNLDPRGE